jgi:hypothetical protein
MSDVDELRKQLFAEKERSFQLEAALNEERAARKHVELSLQDWKRKHGALATSCEIEEECLVNKVCTISLFYVCVHLCGFLREVIFATKKFL